MHRTLIVARMRPDAAEDVARVFAESDNRTDLAGVIGVRARSLFRFGELYLHLIEGDRPLDEAVSAHRYHPEFRRISEDLRPFISPFDPQAWREPKDALATEFYHWERDE
ncbi:MULTISPECIES: TcmI family type II polyketide cyclase [Saccharothrix]|uniref:TcmI family type II polyketide cyclase n=1 Tax=Saccharothrix yanglingensis TaxID=659496 RepID=A0ABU0WVD7_9PSEU|nr:MULTISPECIES: TcmI family type II polyketide cyclase [Saccharothrix]MBY8847756.1 TcmI family type II polyketide cyclase [Saccharothrix sp. MB29]MDQ2583737.1 TcmI family type II polyketide cyclase [Saccharothrix yanglingensis]MDU0287846.1 TcmI family type II polyketide cyclase [Saccharothrix longispora]